MKVFDGVQIKASVNDRHILITSQPW